jgi:hypothetical protein
MLRRVALVRIDVSEEPSTFSETRFLQQPHGVTSQKTPFFIVTALKISNLTYFLLFRMQVNIVLKIAVFWDIKSQFLEKIHYVSATEPSRLMKRKIWGFHGCDYGEHSLLGCDAVWLL